MKLPVTVIILTNNEEKNLPHALRSVVGFAHEIVVVDSGSTDRTVEIARTSGARVIVHVPYENQARQFNWALDNADIKSEWIFRLDADEWLMLELVAELEKELPRAAKETGGFLMKRRVYFMGRWIRHGGYYPTWILRLFRNGQARYEDRAMDEHLVVSKGRVERLENDFVDENRKGLANWIAKHNDFSTREALERLRERTEMQGKMAGSLEGAQAEQKRWVKNNLYLKFPLFLRAFGYFLYRYIIRLGFLDGREGLIFHFLQGCWHQFLIDAKEFELKRAGSHGGH